MLDYLRSCFKSKDIRAKIFFTLAVFALVRFISHIPLPQIDREQLAAFLSQSENQVFGVLSMFTGGSLTQLSIDMLGVGPYITASIIVQLLTKAIPKWEMISKEGNSGREKLNQYSRYLTLPLAIIQGYSMILLFKSQGILSVVTTQEIIGILLVTTATSLLVMWLGELITERGIGNGISMIISIGIIASLPTQISNTSAIIEAGNIGAIITFLVVALLAVYVIVFVNEAERKIPITQARRGFATKSSVDSYLPIKVNTSGVIPIIFALSFMTFPAVIARFLSTANSEAVRNFAQRLTDLSNDNLYYGIGYFVLVFVFTFVYTYIVFQPEQIAENLQKQGSFIPGVRLGSETIAYLKQTILRLTVIGAVFLSLIAVMPIVMQETMRVDTLVIGGTSILIIVSVIIETARQLNSLVLMRRYDN